MATYSLYRSCDRIKFPPTYNGIVYTNPIYANYQAFDSFFKLKRNLSEKKTYLKVCLRYSEVKKIKMLRKSSPLSTKGVDHGY
jgi:hypothetical protein